MAYVARRPGGRYEIREAISTPMGPRARSLANFAVLTEAVLQDAARRATRPFERRRVLASAERAGAPFGPGPMPDGADYGPFLGATGRMRRSMDGPVSTGERARDPGAALLDLLRFADEVAAGRPPRRFEPLGYPPLARLENSRRR